MELDLGNIYILLAKKKSIYKNSQRLYPLEENYILTMPGESRHLLAFYIQFIVVLHVTLSCQGKKKNFTSKKSNYSTLIKNASITIKYLVQVHKGMLNGWVGFPSGTSGKEPACQCRRHKTHRFNPWVMKWLNKHKWMSVWMDGWRNEWMNEWSNPLKQDTR